MGSSSPNRDFIPRVIQNLASGNVGASDLQQAQPFAKQSMCKHMLDAANCKDEDADDANGQILNHPGYIYDEVRLCWVKATPEEQVRQQWLKWMVHGLQYPKELLVVEKELKELPHLFGKMVPERRIDILCYGKEIHPSHPLYPLVVIECKKDECLTEAAIDQVLGYNHHVMAYFVAVVNFKEVRLGCFNADRKKYQFYSVLPAFKELMQWVKS